MLQWLSLLWQIRDLYGLLEQNQIVWRWGNYQQPVLSPFRLNKSIKFSSQQRNFINPWRRSPIRIICFHWLHEYHLVSEHQHLCSGSITIQESQHRFNHSHLHWELAGSLLYFFYGVLGVAFGLLLFRWQTKGKEYDCCADGNYRAHCFCFHLFTK